MLELFEATLAQQVALALFIPLVTGIAGNTGSQAATTITRAVALGDVRLGDVFRVVFKEVRVGLLLGVLLASIAFVIASLAYGLDMGSVIAVTLVLNCPIAATVGGAVPWLRGPARLTRRCSPPPSSPPFATRVACWSTSLSPSRS
nr:magnesium transporter [Parenemella sanctibonifatiensis]